MRKLARLEKSLTADLQVDEAELRLRKALVGFTEEDISFLLIGRTFVMPAVDSVIEEFYRRQLALPEIALIIGAGETLSKLQAIQRKYIDELFSGTYDKVYANNRLRIGVTHMNIGVAPKYYVYAVKLLQSILLSTVRARISDEELASGVACAIEKLFHLDTALVIDGYLQTTVSELKSTTKKALAYAARLEEKVTEIEVLSRIDSLTGLLNRRAFLEELRKELSRATRTASPVSLLYLDVDDFKAINDRFGHARGDEVLTTIAHTLKADLRETDFAGRLGGDEFCVIFSAINLEQAHLATERFIARLREVSTLTVSTGIATTGPGEFCLPEVLIAEADRVMFETKSLRALLRRKQTAAAYSMA